MDKKTYLKWQLQVITYNELDVIRTSEANDKFDDDYEPEDLFSSL